MSENKIESDIFSKRYYDFLEKISDDIYLQSLSKEHVKKLLDEAKEIRQVYKNLELIVKRDANSLYGTSASIYFSLCDFDVAEDITVSGKHAGVIVDTAINLFFKFWGDDELKIIQKFYPFIKSLKQFTEYVPDTKNDLCVYGDTDSRYIDIGKIYSFLLLEEDEFGFIDSMKIPDNTTEGNNEIAEFGKFIYDTFLKNIIAETLNADILERNAKPGFLRMAHEVTARKCIFQAKKKYIMTNIWKDGKTLSKPSLLYKGVELKKGEINKRMKKIITMMVEKFLLENYTVDEIRADCLKLIKYIKARAEKEYIFLYTGVNGLKAITKNPDGIYVSNKNHIQMQIALFWYNFINKNGISQDYQFPFEGQKMMFYYDINDKVVGVPDDVDINKVPGLPEPDWNRMLNRILVKSILKYISELNNKEITDKEVTNFLINVRKIKI